MYIILFEIIRFSHLVSQGRDSQYKSLNATAYRNIYIFIYVNGRKTSSFQIEIETSIQEIVIIVFYTLITQLILSAHELAHSIYKYIETYAHKHTSISHIAFNWETSEIVFLIQWNYEFHDHITQMLLH